MARPSTETSPGEIYGELTVLRRTEKGADGRWKILVLCSCGWSGEKRERDVHRGYTRSCGHVHREKSAGLCREVGKTNRGKPSNRWKSA